MKITSITAGWSETANLGDYNNVRPSVTITADLDDGDDPVVVRGQLIVACRQAVRDQIDQTLELHCQPMLYYEGPLYQVRYSRQAEAVVVCPNDPLNLPGHYTIVVTDNGRRAHGLRLERAQKLASLKAAHLGFDYYDCSDDDYTAVEARREEIEADRQEAEGALYPADGDKYDVDAEYPDPDDDYDDDDWGDDEEA